MSRKFTHAFANDYVAFAAGNGAGLDGGPTTTLVLWKADSSTDHGLLVGLNGAASPVMKINPFSDGRNYFSASGFAATTSWTTGTWYLAGWTKANGSAAVRGHQYDYTATTWAHTDYGSVSDSAAGPITEWRAGWASSSGDRLDGKIAAIGIWGSVLSDGQIEGLTAALADWKALSPTILWAFNQASTSDSVLDLTGGGADQSSLSGTSVSADEPSPWSYALAGTGRWGVHL